MLELEMIVSNECLLGAGLRKLALKLREVRRWNGSVPAR